MLLGSLLPSVAASAVQYQLIVTCGEKSDKFVLSEKPVVTFEDQQMIVTVEGQDFTNYKRSEVTDIRFDEVEKEPDTPDVPTSIEQSEEEPLHTMTFTYVDGRNIYLENIESGARIAVYDISGRMLQPEVERNGVNATINLDNVPSGTLVVVVGNKSYKIIKPRR